MKKQEEISYPEYVQMYVPDKKLLGELLEKAKGNGTMADFAKKCGVSPTTFSRIVNQSFAKPLTKELIAVIAENSEEPIEVDYEALMRANGGVPKEELHRPSYISEKQEKRMKDRDKLETDVWTIVVDALYSHGYMLRLIKYAEDNDSKLGLFLDSEFSVHLQGMEPSMWNFRVDYYKEKYPLTDERDRMSLKSRLMRRSSVLLLRDALEKESLKNSMNSFVFVDRKVYEVFCELMEEIKVNSYMSAILIDADRRKVVEEKAWERKDKKAVPFQLMR